jgi:UDP-2-acetamido-3-amino-2,3-dideoxy-glucuronate N-acetyltransferase
MVGNPARQKGWMSRHGEKLDLPVQIGKDEKKEAVCPATGELYLLQGDSIKYVP